MPLDKSRIQGFGSDSAKEKVAQCPGGHTLQPWTAQPGTCDGCQQRIHAGDRVMDCRHCNWYLCNNCQPVVEEEEQDWFWGTMNYLVETVSKEVEEIREDFRDAADELGNFVSDFGFNTTCGAPSSAQFKHDEIRIGDDDDDDTTAFGDAAKRETATPGDDAKEGEQPAPEKQSDAAAASGSREAAEAGKDDEATPSTVASKPMEDLLDIGQDDLLSLEQQPAAQAAPPAAPAEIDLFGDTVDSPAAAAAVQAAPAAPAELDLFGDTVDAPASAAAVQEAPAAQAAPAAASAAAAAPAGDLLDFSDSAAAAPSQAPIAAQALAATPPAAAPSPAPG
eukprot:CAMPEP_0176224160 /NCGR_PEP_ID=MMETSP0121_2-20121125/21112_1 /TAXON_ID=160619 /ORGANISM="Kryptoperidinium foliaceum, Strain CCMP 1326" /LENGTH=335 /DNA_ID=CAMNT_0017563407 /DNA_START=58 /DNA_END=1062 /DNA_ORIENTATION=+